MICIDHEHSYQDIYIYISTNFQFMQSIDHVSMGWERSDGVGWGGGGGGGVAASCKNNQAPKVQDHSVA